VRGGVERQSRRRQTVVVEEGGSAAAIGGRQDRLQDAADRIQKLARHEHEHDDHQRLGHVVLCACLLGHVLTTRDNTNIFAV